MSQELDESINSLLGELKVTKKKKKKNLAKSESESTKEYDEIYPYEFLVRRYCSSGNVDTKPSRVPTPVLLKSRNKVIIVNFGDICSSLNRNPSMVSSYFLSELNTTGCILESDRFKLKGVWNLGQMLSILKKYINGYVLCAMCKSLHTVLYKENRLTFLVCNKCGASRSV